MRSVILFAVVAGLAFGAAGVADANTVQSSTMWFQGELSFDGTGYTGVLRCLDEAALGIGDGVAGFDIYGKEGATAYFGDNVPPVTWTSQTIASHDAWPTWNPDTPDWYQYSLDLSLVGSTYRWALRNHAGATAATPWYIGGDPARGVPMSGTMDWTSMFAAETDVGLYLSGMGTAEIPGGAAGYGGGAQAWDMDWSWGSEVVPLQYSGFAVSMTLLPGAGAQGEDEWRVSMTPVPEPATLALLGLGLPALAFLKKRRK